MNINQKWVGLLALLLLVIISHGRPSKALSGRQNTEGNGNVNPTADQGTEVNHLSRDAGKHEKLNGSVNADPSRLLERLTFTPSSLPLSEGKDENPAVEPEDTAEAWPEPGPDWSKAFGEWGAAWEFHVYLFALIFLGFAVYATYFIGHGLYVGLNQKYLGFCLNVVMLILGFTRAFVLFADPYHQGDIIHNVSAMRVLWSLGSPCLTSADFLVILALVETAKISLAPPKMQKLSYVLTIIIVHFVLVLVVVSEFVEAKAMVVFCQWFFIVWGSILGVGYFVLAYKLDRKLFGDKEVKSKNEVLYIRLIFASGVNNFAICAMFIYASTSVFGVYSDVKFVDSWAWWALQTCFRIIEVSSGILVFTVSAKRKSLKRKTDCKTNNEYELDDVNISSDANKVGEGSKQEMKLSMFSQLRSKKNAVENQGNNDYKTKGEYELDDANISSDANEVGEGRKQERKLSMFSQLCSKKSAVENQGKNDYKTKGEYELDVVNISSDANKVGEGRKEERNGQFYSKKNAAENQGKNEVPATITENDSDHDMLTDLHEAKIEAYHAHEDV